MSAAAQVLPRPEFRKIERNFLGSNWSFYVLVNGHAFWIHHKTETVLPSSRDSEKEK